MYSNEAIGINTVVTAILGLILLGVIAGSWIASKQKARGMKERASKVVERRPQRLRDVLWSPMHQELSQVVATNGTVTDPKSEWSRIEALAKNEAGAKFQHGMYEYLQQRRRVVDMSYGLPRDVPVPAEVQAEQDKLVEISEELLEQVGSAANGAGTTPGGTAARTSGTNSRL